MQPIFTEPDNVQIQGVVVGVMRKWPVVARLAE
jgi:SOS-response transcriptional repressor LexA